LRNPNATKQEPTSTQPKKVGESITNHLSPRLKGAKLWVVLFWLTKYDGQAPLGEKMTGGANVAVVWAWAIAACWRSRGGVGGGELVAAPTAAGSATTAVAASPQRQRSTFLDLASRWLPGWQDILVVVSAGTVLRWHHRGWRAYWRWRSRHGARAGRHPIAPEPELQALIGRMAAEN
jgi:hypothetical protein